MNCGVETHLRHPPRVLLALVAQHLWSEPSTRL